ncbi:glycosyltransferase [Mycobacterium sp.]|uniref:glycosyltransferase n=1 Tax=Mycobacterium sp. TaxID=1785 RepID=UPI002BE426CA|nr:glycosyltransferase [Mycobacterium sp.]HKP41442.1 glycosyltransferase [Mycobacterium sp.]
MSTIAIAAIGSRGDVAPLTGVGVRLQQAGHRVVMAAYTPFADLISSCGLEFRELPVDFPLAPTMLTPLQRRSWNSSGRAECGKWLSSFSMLCVTCRPTYCCSHHCPSWPAMPSPRRKESRRATHTHRGQARRRHPHRSTGPPTSVYHKATRRWYRR